MVTTQMSLSKYVSPNARFSAVDKGFDTFTIAGFPVYIQGMFTRKTKLRIHRKAWIISARAFKELQQCASQR